MRIPSARYITEDDIKIITIKEITKKKYEAIYKGNLYCPTDHCMAKLSYCSGPKAHYKTWRHSNHSSNCIYRLERTGRKFVLGHKNVITMNISNERKYNALTRAYKSMVQLDTDDSELNKLKPTANQSPKKEGEIKDQTVQMKLFGGELNDGDEQLKGKKLLSKFVNAISSTDIGQVRLIKGFVKDVELIDSVAEIIVGYEDADIKIVFEESFKKEPLNKSYLDKFWAIKELLTIQKVVVFNGVGEVREDQLGKYELSVSLGSDIRLNGEDLYNIARSMMLSSAH